MLWYDSLLLHKISSFLLSILICNLLISLRHFKFICTLNNLWENMIIIITCKFELTQTVYNLVSKKEVIWMIIFIISSYAQKYLNKDFLKKIYKLQNHHWKWQKIQMYDQDMIWSKPIQPLQYSLTRWWDILFINYYNVHLYTFIFHSNKLGLKNFRF